MAVKPDRALCPDRASRVPPSCESILWAINGLSSESGPGMRRRPGAWTAGKHVRHPENALPAFQGGYNPEFAATLLRKALMRWLERPKYRHNCLPHNGLG